MASSYTVTGAELTGSVADDPALCRVTGYLRDIHGNVLKGWKLTVSNLCVPAAVGSTTLILKEHQEVRASSTGKVVFDLYQGATIRIEMPGRVNEIVKEVVVPTETSIDLVGLVFPYLESVTFDDGATATATVEEQFTLDITGLLSNGEEASASMISALEWSIDDEDVLERVSGSTFRALATGVAVVTITDVDTDEMTEYQEPDGDAVVFLSHPTITLDSITITVS